MPIALPDGESVTIFGRSVDAGTDTNSFTNDDVYTYHLGLINEGGELKGFVEFTSGDNGVHRFTSDAIIPRISSDSIFLFDQWTHIAGRFDASTNKLSLFINGRRLKNDEGTAVNSENIPNTQLPALTGGGPLEERIGFSPQGQFCRSNNRGKNCQGS